MDLPRLQELQQKLRHDKDLAPVWDYFLTHLAEDPAFIALGERFRDPFVESVVTEVGRQLYGPGGKVRGLLLSRLPDQAFIHGGFSVAGRVGAVFYFEDVGMGLVAVAENAPSTLMRYARFSGHPIRRPGEPSAN